MKKRPNRISITEIEGLSNETLDLKKILKNMKQIFNCNGCIEERESGFILRLAHDRVESASKFLVENNICKESEISK